jgi:hypothetical protein
MFTNRDEARHQVFTTPGQVGVDAGFPYAVKRATEQERNAIRVESSPYGSVQLGQQASPAGVQSWFYREDGENWPGDVEYSPHREAARTWYGGQYPSIPQSGLDIESHDRALGGLPGSVNANATTNRGPVESNTMEDFTLYGDVLRLVRPTVSSTGPVIGGRDWRGILTGQLSQESVSPPLTTDVARFYLANE